VKYSSNRGLLPKSCFRDNIIDGLKEASSIIVTDNTNTIIQSVESSIRQLLV
jgi:hypothetical protein